MYNKVERGKMDQGPRFRVRLVLSKSCDKCAGGPFRLTIRSIYMGTLEAFPPARRGFFSHSLYLILRESRGVLIARAR